MFQGTIKAAQLNDVGDVVEGQNGPHTFIQIRKGTTMMGMVRIDPTISPEEKAAKAVQLAQATGIFGDSLTVTIDKI